LSTPPDLVLLERIHLEAVFERLLEACDAIIKTCQV